MESEDDEDFGDFDLLLGGEERVGSLEDVSVFTHSNVRLANANVLTKKMKKWMKSKHLKHQDIKFFKDRKSLQHTGIKIFKKIEQ